MFDTNTNICSDDCWKNAKEVNNNKIEGYNIYPTNLVACESPFVRMTDMYLKNKAYNTDLSKNILDNKCSIKNKANKINVILFIFKISFFEKCS